LKSGGKRRRTFVLDHREQLPQPRTASATNRANTLVRALVFAPFSLRPRGARMTESREQQADGPTPPRHRQHTLLKNTRMSSTLMPRGWSLFEISVFEF
jgi:hypothetical protein